MPGSNLIMMCYDDLTLYPYTYRYLFIDMYVQCFPVVTLQKYDIYLYLSKKRGGKVVFVKILCVSVCLLFFKNK